MTRQKDSRAALRMNEKVGRWEEEKLLTLKCSNLSHEMHTESPKPSAYPKIILRFVKIGDEFLTW